MVMNVTLIYGIVVEYARRQLLDVGREWQRLKSLGTTTMQ
jgi:hypothetical protein